jgi:hypothetical protein
MVAVPNVMVTVQLPVGETDLPSAQRRLGLADDEVDRQFGLVAIDPDHRLYTLLVTVEAAERIVGKGLASGPYANPRIEPFGPPQ